MHNKHLFEYAVIRVMPRVEREEFINVGVILYCAEQQFLQTAFAINRERLLAFYKDIDIQEIEERLEVFQRICKGGKEGEREGRRK